MKKLIISLFIIVASVMSACGKTEKTATTETIATPETPVTTVYAGAIGDYKIHMVLDENFEGYYYYDHRPDSHFKLVKTHESECNEEDDYYGYSGQGECYAITLQEYAPGTNKNTGEFEGYFVHARLDGAWIKLYEGIWYNKNNGNSLEFGVYPAEEY